MNELRGMEAGDFWRWVLRRYRRHRVTGRSMLPTLQPNTEILYDPAATPAANDLVIARHPLEDRLIVKRLSETLPGGQHLLLGDNRAESSDSRTFGPVTSEHLIGIVVCTFP